MLYARAVAQYQVKEFEKAEAGLRENIAKFPKSESIQDSQYLLAFTLAAQASDAKTSKEQALAKFEEATKLLGDIVKRRTDVALANDAQYQIGEVLISRANSSEPAEKAALYQKALEAYRAVEPKELMVKAQEARVANVKERRTQALAARQTAEFKHLERVLEHEQVKLSALKEKSDTTVSAQIRAGITYFMQQKFDESRVVLNQAKQFAQDEEQQKEILYYTTLTYALQTIVDKAIAGYDEFFSKNKGDPMADNLPLVVGGMFLAADPKVNNPEKALKYFKEGTEMYKNGRLTAETLTQQATALVMLKRYDEALKTFRDFLTKNPTKELAAAAEFGIATIYKDTNKIDDAINAFKTTRDKYAGTAPAEQSAFWVAQLLLQKGDAKAALPELTSFIAKFPQSELKPAAMFSLAQAQQSTGNKDAALATYKDLAQQFPKSQPAPFAYFQQAQIYAGMSKVDEMIATMKEFIEKYPDNEIVFSAYDTIGQNLINANKPLEAIANYNEMAEKLPQNRQAPAALLKVSSLWLGYAQSQGRYIALNPQQREEWNKGVNGSMEAAQKVIENYPESNAVALALQTLLQNEKLLLAAKLKSEAEVEKYFQDFANKFESKPATKSKILFTLASLIFEKDKAKALQQMNAAYDPKLVYAPADIDLYGGALIESGKLDEAQKVYEKLAADYPNPPGAAPEKAPTQIMEAQATSLYGMGKTLQKQGKVAEAGAKFDALKKLYPWSPKILEANFGIAQSLYQQKKYDEAAALLVQIIRAPTATADLRANSMLLGGDVQSEKGQTGPAIDYYMKIATFYEGVPVASAEGLWRGGQALEKQAATLTETSKPKKSEQLAKAIKGYKDLVQKYPNAPSVTEGAGAAAGTRSRQNDPRGARHGFGGGASARLSRCALRAEFRQPARTARRHDPFRAMHRQAREHRHGGTVPAVPDAAQDFAAASQEQLEEAVKSTGFFRNKAKEHPGLLRATSSSSTAAKFPQTMEELTALAGVGRKTANVVLGNAFGINVGVVVDTHVARLSQRLGLTKQTDPVKIEQDLMKLVPREQWTLFSHWLIWHGRRRCCARKPDCAGCEVQHLCPSAFKIKGSMQPKGASGLQIKQSR